MRAFLFLALRFTGLPFLLRELVQRRCVSILCYHDPDPEHFRAHLQILTRLYHVVSLRQYLAWRADPKQRLPRKALVITFDDGHRNNYQLRDLLQQLSVPSTIFLCSQIVGTWRHYWWKAAPASEREQLKDLSDADRRWQLANFGFAETREYAERQALSVREIEALRPFVDFQSHTRFHPILPRCTDAHAAEEIRQSKSELERRFGLSIYALAYPNGDYTVRDAKLARESGYECALTIDGGYNTRRTDRYRLRRIRLADDAGAHELIVKASGLWGIWEWLNERRARAKRAMTPTQGEAVHVGANVRTS